MGLIQNAEDVETFPGFLEEHPYHKGAALEVCLPAPDFHQLLLFMNDVCSVILVTVRHWGIYLYTYIHIIYTIYTIDIYNRYIQ